MINGLFVRLGRDGPDHTAAASGGRLWRNAGPVGERCSLHLSLSVAGGLAGPEGRSDVTWAPLHRKPRLVSQHSHDTHLLLPPILAVWACVTSQEEINLAVFVTIIILHF